MVDVCDKNRVDEAGRCLECRVLSEEEGTCVCLRENGKCHGSDGSAKRKAGPKRVSGTVAGITFTAEVVEDDDDAYDGDFEDELECGGSGAGSIAGGIGRGGNGRGRGRRARLIPDPEENWDGFYAEFLKFSQDRPVGRHTLDDDDAA